MSNNLKQESIFRYGGIAAILSVCFGITFIAIFAGVGPGNTPTGILGITSNVAFRVAALLALAAATLLFTDLRLETGRLALVALLFYGLSDFVVMFIDPINVPPVPWGTLTVAHGLGILLFGWQQYNHPNYKKGLGILGMIAGLLFLVGGMALIITASADSLGPFPLLLMISKNAWLVWLGLHFLNRGSIRLSTENA